MLMGEDQWSRAPKFWAKVPKHLTGEEAFRWAKVMAAHWCADVWWLVEAVSANEARRCIAHWKQQQPIVRCEVEGLVVPNPHGSILATGRKGE
jgi:hypothetical protein